MIIFDNTTGRSALPVTASLTFAEAARSAPPHVRAHANVHSPPIFAGVVSGKKIVVLAALLLQAAFGFTQTQTGQNLVQLDAAIRGSTEYLVGRVPATSKVLILNFQSDSTDLSNYIIDELTSAIVNDTSFTVVERTNLEVLQKELDFQLSGEVSDETAVSVGKRLGAQSIVLGSIMTLGDIYRLTMRVIEVETAKLQGMRNANIVEDPILAALLGKTFTGSQSRYLANQMFGEDLWKNKRFYAGLRSGGSNHLYDIKTSAFNGGSVNKNTALDVAAQFAVQIHPLFALQMELLLTADSVAISSTEQVMSELGGVLWTYDTLYTFTSQSLLIPLLAKLTLRPGIFSFGIFAGAYFSIPLGTLSYADSFTGENMAVTMTPEPGWAAGGSAGMKLGPGALFVDLRYMADFEGAKIQRNGSIVESYRRSMMTFGLGYETGLMNIKK
jgi:TolB-like protein